MCDCPKTDAELAQAVLAADADELLVCGEAYEALVKLTYGKNANGATCPVIRMHRGNYLMDPNVPTCDVKLGKSH